MLYTDVRYLKQVSYRLERFKIKKDTGNSFLANCRCNLCGDSEKNSKKARGYFYGLGNKLLFRCHNCNASLTFSTWLKEFDANIYGMYSLDNFKEKNAGLATLPETTQKLPDLRTKPYRPCVLTGLKSVLQLNDDHPVLQYVSDRKIPEKFWDVIYYAPKFFKWTLGHTDKFSRVVSDFPEQEHPRLIIPWFTADTKEVFMYHARAFGKEVPKYYSIKIDKKPPPFFGLDRLNKEEKVYVVEGPLDSLFLPNAVAVGSSALHTFEDAGLDITYVMDNENRNREILKEYSRLINRGNRVCILPETYKYKDINEAILAGLTSEEIVAIIDGNTYNGISATIKLNEWRKVKE